MILVEVVLVVFVFVIIVFVVGLVCEEKVELVLGDGLKVYSVVCGSFGVKVNVEGLK